MARYDAIGSFASQVHVVQPLRLLVPCEVAVGDRPASPAGTVISNVYAALSVGWSLTGNQVAATCGSPTTSAPSSVWMKPDSADSIAWLGDAVVRTTTVKRLRPRMPVRGVIDQLAAGAASTSAGRPSTSMERTVQPDEVEVEPRTGSAWPAR